MNFQGNVHKMNTTIDTTVFSLSKFKNKCIFSALAGPSFASLKLFTVSRQKLHMRDVHLHFSHQLHLVMKLTMLKSTPTFILLIYSQITLDNWYFICVLLRMLTKIFPFTFFFFFGCVNKASMLKYCHACRLSLYYMKENSMYN